jgi:hypothetical protein
MQTVDIVNSLPKVDFGSSGNESEIVKMYPAQEESDEMIIAAEPEI